MNYQLTHEGNRLLSNGSWSGVVGQIQRGDAEFSAVPVEYIREGYNAVQYVTSLQVVRVCITFLQPKLFGTYKALFLPLDAEVWIYLGICTVVSIIAFRLLVPFDKTSLHNDGWGGSTFLVISCVANQGIPDNTYYLSTRIVYIAVLLVSFFVGVYYNTAMLNSLILQSPNAIQTAEQFLDGNLRLGVLDTPYFREEMANEEPLTAKLKEKLDLSKPPHYFSVANGASQIRNGLFGLYTQDEAIYEQIANTFTDAEVCSVSEVETYRPFHMAVIARHNGQYKEQFSRAFILMKERGLIDAQRKFWLRGKLDCFWKQDALSIGVEPLFLAYVCMGFGALFSLLICLLENLHHRGTFIRLREKYLKNYVRKFLPEN